MSTEASLRAADAGLPRVGRRPTLAGYGLELWRRRQLTAELARSRFRAENEANRLGMAWIVIRPLLNAGVYGVVFGLLLRSSTRPDNFVPFLVIGIFVFQFFAGCLTDGARAITGNVGLVRTLSFPRAVLPLSLVLQNVLALVPMMLTAVVLVPVFGEPLRWSWLLALPALGLLVLFTTGVALASARLTLHVRDVTQLIPFVTRLLFYISGIFFSIDRIGLPPAAELVARLNPVQVYITLVRSGFLTEVEATSGTWLLGVGWAVLALVVGALFFWAAEERYGRV
ncbi:ABC transporter permease [Pseudokineococcus basanitobsidens]|uniref:Transport permease protein n=1 Tax=Pseudokineococcus basanitobsidens TaxID=1926649 RepID=A0ABU8RL67_9ACTN